MPILEVILISVTAIGCPVGIYWWIKHGSRSKCVRDAGLEQFVGGELIYSLLGAIPVPSSKYYHKEVVRQWQYNERITPEAVTVKP